MKTISFINMKGGVGKTTTSFNVAAGLAQEGFRVLLVDLDPQANTTSIFIDETPAITINTLLKDGGSADEATIKVTDNLWLLPSELALSNTEMDLRLKTGVPQHNRLKKILAPVAVKYDFCIIDCSPTINLLTVNEILVSSQIIIPIKPDRFAIQGFNETSKTIEVVSENYEVDVDFKILFTIVNRNNEEKALMEQLASFVGDNKVFKTMIRNQPKPVAAASSRCQLVINDPAAMVAQDLKTLVKEILGE